jgi:hypothetical protein
MTKSAQFKVIFKAQVIRSLKKKRGYTNFFAHVTDKIHRVAEAKSRICIRCRRRMAEARARDQL